MPSEHATGGEFIIASFDYFMGLTENHSPEKGGRRASRKSTTSEDFRLLEVNPPQAV
jgi:hypothetical protein